jgi:hypothetical protein
MLSGAVSALSAGSGLARSLSEPVSYPSEPLVRGLTQDARLYGSTAAEIDGKAKLNSLKIAVNCSDSSSMKWNVTVPEKGEHDLFLSYSVSVPGFSVAVGSGPVPLKSSSK